MGNEWSTGSVVNASRALLHNKKVVAIFDDVVTCTVVVRELNDSERNRAKATMAESHVKILQNALADHKRKIDALLATVEDDPNKPYWVSQLEELR